MDWASVAGVVVIVLISSGVLAAVVTHLLQGRRERAKEASQTDREESLRRRDTQREPCHGFRTQWNS